jgi:hypothetical protein
MAIVRLSPPVMPESLSVSAEGFAGLAVSVNPGSGTTAGTAALPANAEIQEK